FLSQNLSAVLGALAGLTYLEAYEGKPKRAIALLTLILHHHACTHELKNELNLLRSELIAELSASLIAAAEAIGMETSVDDVAQSFLADNLFQIETAEIGAKELG
ncbi:MAG: hypothetical protein AAF614_43680, partial [Chloroflexota bacterium]